MTEQDYRRLFDRVAPGPELVERTIKAAEGGVRPRRRAPLRRLAALAACVGLVLGLFNYQALAAGAERVLHYFFGVGAAEQEESLLIQEEALSMENRENLFLIVGAYQRDGLLTVPLDVLSRSETPDRVWDRQKFRMTVYGADGEKLPCVVRTAEGELTEVANSGRVEDFSPLEGWLSWLSQTYLPQGYANGGSMACLMKVPQGQTGPYTFEVEAYSISDGWGEVLWSGTLALDTPQALDSFQTSWELGEGTVTALVAANGHSVAFYARLDPERTEAGEYLVQLVVPEVWFVDEEGNRYQGYMRRYTLAEEYLPEFRLVGEPEGEIVAIEVEQVGYSIARTTRPLDSDERQYYPVYKELDWVISLS